MKRPKSHQIDELATRILSEALPASWVCNPLYKDYAIDYLVQIGNDDDTLTGLSFYIQLKGKAKVRLHEQGATAKFSLATKHALYYLDKVRDLPVFLVLADVDRKCGWWVFLQKALHSDQSWRCKGSHTLNLPITNLLHDPELLRQAVEDAKDWMRGKYPQFHTPFLRECFDYLCNDHGLPDASIIDNGMIERMHVAYGLEHQNEIASYDHEFGEWDFHDCKATLLHLDLYSNGRLTISECDDDGIYVDAPIRNPEELGEIFYLTESLNEKIAQEDSCVSMPLSSLIRALDIVVPFHDKYFLVSPSELFALSPQSMDILNCLLDDRTVVWGHLSDIGFGGWEDWCRQHLSLPARMQHRKPGSNVCVYSRQTGMTTYRRWIAYGEIYRDFYPPIAITRVAKSCSVMFLCDFFNESDAGQNALRKLLRRWSEFSDVATEILIEIPSSILTQIRKCIEVRIINREAQNR